MYQAGKDNLHADALSRQPYLPAPVEGVAQVVRLQKAKFWMDVDTCDKSTIPFPQV